MGALSESIWRSGIINEISSYGIESGRVFDIGAGMGIGARLLKEQGVFYVISVDRNASMLDHAKTYSDDVVVSDIKDLDSLGEKANIIMSGFDTMNYLSPPLLSNFFKFASRNLMDDGLLIFDYSSPMLLRELWNGLEYEQDLLGGSKLLWKHVYNFTSDHCITNISLIQDGIIQWNETHIQYAMDCYDMHKAALAAGLSIVRIRNLEDQLFSPSTETHLFVLTKVKPQK